MVTPIRGCATMRWCSSDCNLGAYGVRYLFVICGFSSAEAATLVRYAKAKRQRDGFQIEIDKDKTPGGEQYPRFVNRNIFYIIGVIVVIVIVLKVLHVF
jgi:hypothetical protein